MHLDYFLFLIFPTYVSIILNSNIKLLSLKSIILFPFRFIYKIYFLACFVILLVLFYLPFRFLLFLKKERFPSAFKLMKFNAKLLLYLGGIFLKIKGKENIIKDQPFLICSNHSSFYRYSLPLLDV